MAPGVFRGSVREVRRSRVLSKRRSTGEKKQNVLRQKHDRIVFRPNGGRIVSHCRGLAPHRQGRKIHFGEMTWTYKITRGDALIRSPDGTQLWIVPLPLVTGVSYAAMERAAWKGSPSAWVTPAMVKEFIVNVGKGAP